MSSSDVAVLFYRARFGWVLMNLGY